MKVFNKLDVARKVYVAFMRKYKALLQKQVDEVSVRAYCNGREQGYSVTVTFKGPAGCSNTVQFAEYRSSDSIVVYAGNLKDELLPEAKREAIYDTKEFATPGNYDRAAKLVARAVGLI